MTKEEKLQQEESVLLADAYRIFFDANDYDTKTLIGYCRLVREIFGNEINNMVCDISLYQLIKVCQEFRPNTQTALKYRFGLNGEEPISYTAIGKKIYCSTDTTSSFCKQAITKLRSPVLSKRYNILVRKSSMVLQCDHPTNMHISTLKLSTKAYNALFRAGIYTVEQFLRLDEISLRNIKSFGDKIVAEVLAKQKSITEKLNDN